MSLKGILEVKILDVWGICFMGPFTASNTHQYILVAVDYVSNWAKVVALPMNDAKVVVNFVKRNIFTRFRTPRALIVKKKLLGNLCAYYGVRHNVATYYHPQTSGQVVVSNK
ncbi:uncharacterized protein LOC142163040 [Nicotiana tabacum]|uniref:Uncharacterized protein LOC142163040 n=1 Tax=Nicotiana tabacum TaxID=4097 RepID=A0AC58RUI8_TOBAC